MRPLVLIIAFLLFTAPLRAHDIQLISMGDTWRFFQGRGEPSVFPGAWAQPAFNDSTWPTALSSLSTPALFPETTVVQDYGLGYTSIYFRKKFQVDDLARVAQLILRIDYDDGFIAYVNGVEVARRGVTDPKPFQPVGAHASYHVRGPTEHIDVSSGIPHLVRGENTLAIHLLGSVAGDLTACMVAELYSNFARAPYVQNNTSNSVQIIYKTLSFAPSEVEIGVDQAITSRVPVALAETNHVATITNLVPGTVYQYRVHTVLNGKPAMTDWTTFETFAASGPLSFVVMGDSGWATHGQIAIANQLERHKPDLMLHVGDIVYYSFSHAAADFRCFSHYSNFMRETPVFIALGNHDSYIDRLAILESFYLPTNRVTQSEHYYSFDHGDAHFVALWADLQAGSSYHPGSPQYNWLEADLAASRKPWKFLFFHHLVRSSAGHKYDNYDFNGVLDTVQIQQSIEELAARHGVQIIFNGHDHDYERFTPSRGVMSVVSGGGGGALYGLSEYEEGSVQFFPEFHTVYVDVQGDVAKIQALNAHDVVLDSFEFVRSFPQRRPYQGTFHTPLIEQNVAPDADGNIPGQKFDFAGERILPKTGKFSSAGRLVVNSDRTNLYLGIDQLSIRSDQDLYVFLEVPGHSGVNSMNGLGDGESGSGEGMEALDWLETLAFTNFRPAIAIMLGDEKADQPNRFHQRPLGIPGGGQGAVWLAGNFPEVIGVEMQQFNRSPQTGPLDYEQNANFVEVAIPLKTLGLRGGEQIKIATVVGMGRDHEIERITNRTIDLGGVAAAVFQEGEQTFIEPLEINLAPAALALNHSVLVNGDVELAWPAQPGLRYELQNSPNVNGIYVNVDPSRYPQIAGANEMRHTIQQTGTSQFYRVKSLP